jgi:hypothetical protein
MGWPMGDDWMQGWPIGWSMGDPPCISPWHEEANAFPHVT